MKNLLSLTAFLFAATIAAHAEERSLAAMQAAAQQVLQQKGYARISPAASTVAPTTPTDIQLFERHAQTAVLGYNDGGFALIGRDDRLPAVLAYCEGSYTEALRNPNFVNYLNTFDGYLDYCAAEGIEPRFINKAATFNPEGVKEIMKCRWDQGGPYNDICPFVYKADKDGNMDDRRCITGCVATAMSQILYTLYTQQDPEGPHRDIRLRGAKSYSYIDDNKQAAFESATFATIPLDWDNMLPTYTATSPYVNRIAVARLMYACGVAAEMMYSTGASGTYCSTANAGLNAFFEGIKAEYSGYGIEDYEQRIYDEFDAGRAVLLSGADKDNNGHAFVGDGYDKNGKIHLNLGWSGGGNGFFTIADMAGYASSQTVNFIDFEEGDDALHLTNDAPIDDLKGKFITADYQHPAESIVEGQWYVLYNQGRRSAAYSSGIGKKVQNSPYIPVVDDAEKAACMIVRFVPKAGSTNAYYIQTGSGDYFGGLTQGGNGGSVKDTTKPYTVGKIQEKKTRKFFWFKQSGTVLDCNAVGGNGVAGWGSTTPTDTLGNASWQLYPVILADTPDMPLVNKVPIDPSHRYVLVDYDGAKNYYLNLKANCSISKTTPSELTITPYAGGWQIANADDPSRVISMKEADFKLGNGSTRNEVPMTFFFEPTGETPDTGNENLDACSRFYRLRCENGYMSPAKIALGGTIYANFGPNAALGRWLLIDQTDLDEMNAADTEAIKAIPAATVPATTPYDLSGRPIRNLSTTPRNLYIQAGKKVLK